MSGWCELHTKRNWEHCSFTTFCERWMKRLYRGNKSQCVYAQRACARSLHMYGLGERASQEIPIQRMHGSNASGLGGMSIISRVLESIRKDAFGCSVVHSERPVSARRSRIFVCVLLSMVINKANASCRLANACGKALKPSLLACVKTGLRARVSHSMVSRWLKNPSCRRRSACCVPKTELIRLGLRGYLLVDSFEGIDQVPPKTAQDTRIPSC